MSKTIDTNNSYFKTVTDLKNATIKLLKIKEKEGYVKTYDMHQLIDVLKNKDLSKKPPTPYLYNGEIKDSRLVAIELENVMGYDIASTVLYALDQCNYFVVPSNDKFKGKYLIIDGLDCTYTENDYMKDEQHLKSDVIQLLNYHKKERYMDAKRADELLSQLI